MLGRCSKCQNRPCTCSGKMWKYVVPAGTEILVPDKTFDYKTRLTGQRVYMIVTTKQVSYETDEICLDPETGYCEEECLKGTIFSNEHNYWGFRLPTNERGAKFILVLNSKVAKV